MEAMSEGNVRGDEASVADSDGPSKDDAET